MKVIVAILFCIIYCSVVRSGPWHASCKIDWAFNVNCTTVNVAIVSQIKKWTGDGNCKHGGEKCLYKLKTSSPSKIEATHTTPVHDYVDDLEFTFEGTAGKCAVNGHSSSETWYAVLDYGTNYCNLHNLITGAELDKQPGYSEKTSNDICTQFTTANCTKY